MKTLHTTDEIHLNFTFQIQYPLTSYCLSNHNSQQMLQDSSTWISSGMDTSDHGILKFFICPRAFAKRFDRTRKRVAKVCLYFKSQLNTLRFLSVPTVKNLKVWVRTNAGTVPRKLRFRGLMNYLLCFHERNSLLKFVHMFCIHPV